MRPEARPIEFTNGVPFLKVDNTVFFFVMGVSESVALKKTSNPFPKNEEKLDISLNFPLSNE